MNDLQYVLERERYSVKYDRACWTMLGVGFIAGAALILALKGCEARIPKTAQAHISADCGQCHNKFTSYFQKKGSKTPEEMANAVLKTKSPRLLAAIAITETTGRPGVRNGGYKKRHSGAWQVSERDWGKVPHDAISQALQAEAVLEELVKDSSGDIIAGLNRYGGDKTRKKYAQNILRELSEVPR